MPLSSNRRKNGVLKPRARSQIHVNTTRDPAERRTKEQFRLTFRMIKALGPSPVYAHSWRNGRGVRNGLNEKTWASAAAEWIKANQKRAS